MKVITQRIYLFYLILCFGCHLQAQSDYQDFDREKLSKILKVIEQRNGVTFSFKNQNVEPFQISLKSGQYNLSQILEAVFGQTILEYEFVDESNILIVDPQLQGLKLCGFLKDSLTGEAISYATVSNLEKDQGVLTNELGYFEFPLSLSTQFLEISYLGYEPLQIVVNHDAVKKPRQYMLRQRQSVFEAVTVIEYMDDGITIDEDANKIQMDPNEMSMLPGNVEKDIVSALQFLPGINSPDESLDRLHVRGGTPDQNLILWDDIPVYHSSHLFGTVTGFNPFVIESLDIYRNGISARYGGRVSSVIDIKSKSKRPDKLGVGLGFNMTQSHLDIETPAGKNAALFLSFRKSLTEGWSSPAFLSYAEKVFQGTKIDVNSFEDIDNKVRFNDLTLKWVYSPGRNNFNFSFLGSNNNLRYVSELEDFDAFSIDQLDLTHGASKVSWDRSWSEKLSSEIVLSTTRFNNTNSISLATVAMPDTFPIFFESQNDLIEQNSRIGLNYALSSLKSVQLGYHYTENVIDLEFRARNFDVQSVDRQGFKNSLHAFYVDYKMLVPDLLKLDIGLRYNTSRTLQNTYFEPRIGLTTEITPDLTLKLSTSKNFQFVSQLIIFDTNELELSSPIWIVSDNENVPVVEANQWTGGILYHKGNWTIDLDAYVKEMTGITSLVDPSISIPFSIGAARVEGFDILVKRRVGKFRSWLSYSLSQAEYEFLAVSPQSFPAGYDQRHVLRWVNIYKTGRWNYSLGISLKSGLPYTDVLSVEGNEIIYGDLNGSRLPRYFKLDASVVYNLKKTNSSRSYLAFSFQNIFDFRNQLSRQYILNDQNQLIFRDEIGLRFTPNFSINYDF